MLTMIEAKKLGVEAAGEEFECPTGARGRILEMLSEHKKVQAELSCVEQGCTNTHIREQSDWHQCGRCPEHSKSKGQKRSSGPNLGGGRSVKLEDGTYIREMKISDTDDAEMRALKEQNNTIFTNLYEKEQARRDQEKAEAKAAREAKMAQDRADREAEKAVEKKEAMRNQLQRVTDLARKNGVAISPTLLAEAKSYGIDVES